MNPDNHTPTHSALPLPSVGATLRDIQEQEGVVRAIHQVDEEMMIWAETPGDHEVVLPLALLEYREGKWHVPVIFKDLRGSPEDKDRENLTVPVWEEVLQVGKQEKDTGKGVRIKKSVTEREETVALSLLHDELDVEEVPIHKLVSSDAMAAPRQEGDTYIIPVFKEVLVVEKRICLEKEVRITRRKVAVQSSQSVSLKAEEVSINEFDEGNKRSH